MISQENCTYFVQERNINMNDLPPQKPMECNTNKRKLYTFIGVYNDIRYVAHYNFRLYLHLRKPVWLFCLKLK